MNKRIKELAEQVGGGLSCIAEPLEHPWKFSESELEKFTQLIVQECINKIETYQISVGNSAAGEMACDWTYDALKEIHDDIKETFGLK
jgi:hypothetical protein